MPRLTPMPTPTATVSLDGVHVLLASLFTSRDAKAANPTIGVALGSVKGSLPSTHAPEALVARGSASPQQ